MQLIEHEVKIKSTTDSVSIFGLGDVHLGTRACNEKLLQRNINRIVATPNARVILMGDLIEAINPSDKRFDANTLSTWIGFEELDNIAMVQCNRIVDTLEPIAGKIIGGVSGNHELTIHKRYHFDATEYVCTRLRDKTGAMIHNLGAGQTIIRLKIKRGQHTSTRIIAAAHGSGCSTTVGGTIQKQVRNLANIECGLLLTGHTHQLTSCIIPRCFVPSSGELKLVNHPKLVVQTGSYLMTYGDGFDTYAERRAYPAVPLGSPEVVITGDDMSMNVVMHTE